MGTPRAKHPFQGHILSQVQSDMLCGGRDLWGQMPEPRQALWLGWGPHPKVLWAHSWLCMQGAALVGFGGLEGIRGLRAGQAAVLKAPPLGENPHPHPLAPASRASSPAALLGRVQIRRQRNFIGSSVGPHTGGPEKGDKAGEGAGRDVNWLLTSHPPARLSAHPPKPTITSQAKVTIKVQVC